MYPPSIEYLSQNGYNYHEDFEDNDPNIIMTALVLFDYSFHQETTKASFTQVLSCIALGSDLGTLTGLGAKEIAKKLAKEVSKAALKRAVPGVGIAVGVVFAALCLSEIE